MTQHHFWRRITWIKHMCIDFFITRRNPTRSIEVKHLNVIHMNKDVLWTQIQIDDSLIMYVRQNTSKIAHDLHRNTLRHTSTVAHEIEQGLTEGIFASQKCQGLIDLHRSVVLRDSRV